MAKKGPKEQPEQRKRARGTSQKCRDNTNNVITIVPVVEGIPAAPDWFLDLADEWSPSKYDIAVSTYGNICGQLFAAQILSRVHVDALATLAALQAEVAVSLKHGKATASTITQLRTLYSEFGLTPASQRAVGGAIQKPSGNKFAANGNRARS